MAATPTSIDHLSCCKCRELYEVTFFNYSIEVAVTSSPGFVSAWLENLEKIHRFRIRRGFIIGLDVEWLPNNNVNSQKNPVSVLQLCVGHHCLVFQILNAKEIPHAPVEFLGDVDYTCVGVGVDGDVRKLFDDYGLLVKNTVGLRPLAAKRLRNPELRNASLTTLASEVLDIEYTKPRNITLSNWATEKLSEAQVQYASIDALLSFEIGRSLNAANG